MVTRDDLQLSHLPAESCANCGFLLQFKANQRGEERSHANPVTLFERANGLDYLNEAVWFGERIKLAALECWMRRGWPGEEARPAISGDAVGKRLILDAMHRDRSESSDAYCPQYTPWVPHLSLQQHWEERKTYLLERDNKKFMKAINDDANRTQKVIAAIAAVTFFATVLVGLLGAKIQASATIDATKMQIAAQATSTPQSTPSTPVAQPSPAPAGSPGR